MKFLEITWDLLGGFGISCLLFSLTLLLAIPLGLALSFCSTSKLKVIKLPSKLFIWIIRGIPLMLFICMIYYLPGLLGIEPNVFYEIDKKLTILSGSTSLLWYGSFLAVLIAFVINYACYFSEIFRGGIESISKGQYEAGQVLGMTKSQFFFKVILKQVIKRIVPAMSNEIITLVKDTALANVIAIPEIIKCAKDMAMTQALVWPLFYTAVFYLLFVGGLTLIFGFVEKKLNYFNA
jgi:polar amino acid transport system permease protein